MAAERKALLARLHAKPNKVDEVRSFLEDALPLAEDEEKTVSWYALQLDETTFGIFDTFAGDDGRQAHLDGAIAQALVARAEALPLVRRAEEMLTEPADRARRRSRGEVAPPSAASNSRRSPVLSVRPY